MLYFCTTVSYAQGTPQGRPSLIRFQEQRQIDKDVIEFSGFVTMEWPSLVLQADYVVWYQTDRKVMAEGDVVVIQGDLHLSGRRLEMNLVTNEVTVFEAHAFQAPEVSGTARKVFKTADDIFKLQNAYVTECHARVPHWSVMAHRVKINPDKYAMFTHGIVKIKSIPILYMPFLRIPLKKERSTGFLFPKFGPNSVKGFFIELPFFWAINRSHDLTLAASWYSRRGWGGTAEYRYVLSETARGDLRANFYDDSLFGKQWDTNWTHQVTWGRGWSWSINADWFSSYDQRQDYGNNFFTRSQRQRYARTYLSGSLGVFSLYGQFDLQEVQFSDKNTVLTARLPSLQLTFYNRRFGPLSLGFDSRYGFLIKDSPQQNFRLHRFDITPRLSLPLSTSWLSITPSITMNTSAYSDSIDATTGQLTGNWLFRPYLQTQVDLRGPVIYRIFDFGASSWTDRLKHVIEPFARWQYSHDFSPEGRSVPGFDFTDIRKGAHTLSVGLTQILYTRTKVESQEQPMPWEWLSWTISESWIFPSQSFQQELNPYIPRFGPLQNSIRLNPNPITSFNAELAIHPKTWTITNMSLTGSWRSSSAFQFSLSWYYNRPLSFVAEGPQVGPASQQVRSNLTTLLGNSLQVQLGTAYDISRKQLLTSQLGVIWQADCFSLGVQIQRFSFGTRSELQYQFSLSIPHVGNLLQFVPGLSGLY